MITVQSDIRLGTGPSGGTRRPSRDCYLFVTGARLTFSPFVPQARVTGAAIQPSLVLPALVLIFECLGM
jgi:hypothetical protein